MPLSSSGLNLAGDLWLELKGSSGFSLLIYLCANWLALLLKQGFFNPVAQGSRRLSSHCRICVMNASPNSPNMCSESSLWRCDSPADSQLVCWCPVSERGFFYLFWQLVAGMGNQISKLGPPLAVSLTLMSPQCWRMIWALMANPRP